MRNSFSQPPGTQHHTHTHTQKKPLGPFVTSGPTRITTMPNFGSWARPGPALWHSLARAPPQAGCPPADGPFLHTILQYSSSRLNAHPFVIQPFNFFQMFPNKQRNKIKRVFFFFFFTTKANGPKTFPACKTMQELAVGGWGWGQEKRSWHFGILPIEIQCVRVSVCVFFVFTRTLVSVH